MRRVATQPAVHGDVTVRAGVDGLTMVIEAFDWQGLAKITTIMSLELYDQEKVDRFAANWRRRMDKKRPPSPPPLHLVKP